MSAHTGVIDVDVHIHEDLVQLAEYAEGTIQRSLAQQAEQERWLDTPGYSPLTVNDPPLSDDPAREIYRLCSPEQLRSDLDDRGVQVAIVYSGRLGQIPTHANPAVAVGLMRAFNRYLSERWLRPDEGIYGAILAAPQDPRAAADDVERYAAHPGCVAVHLPMAGVYPLWGHRRYDPLYAAAEQAGLPVVLQSHTLVHPAFPHQLDQFDTALAKQALSRPFAAMANLVSLVTSGALARFPRLRVVFAECGMSWLPATIWRLDHQYRWTGGEVPEYPSLPSEVIERQVYVTTHALDEPSRRETLLALLADGRLYERTLFSSDWPHYDADTLGRLTELNLPGDWERRIVSDNARLLFGLPLP